MSLAVIGGTVVDVILTETPRLPAWPDHTEFTPANLVMLPTAPLVTLGGNGAKAAYVAASAGARVQLHTSIGKDDLGDLARGWLKSVGCRVSPSRKGKHTAINVTAARRDHARATFFYPGEKIDLPTPRALASGTSHLLVCGWPHPPLPRVAGLFAKLRPRRIFTALDTGPFLGRPWTLAELKPLCSVLDLLLTNEYEITSIVRDKNLPSCLRKLRQCFDGHVVIKRGSKGALWLPAFSNQPCPTKAPRVRTVSTVGAGDSFNGALLAALTLGKEFSEAVERASRTASTIVASPRGVLGVLPR